jgi:glutamine amidotransferase
MRRELLMAIDPGLFRGVNGSTDSETLFYLALSYGLTLFVSEDVEAVQRLHPENPRLRELTEGDRVVVSEPLADLSGAWIEVPESTGIHIDDGSVDRRPFKPQRPG